MRLRWLANCKNISFNCNHVIAKISSLCYIKHLQSTQTCVLKKKSSSMMIITVPITNIILVFLHVVAFAYTTTSISYQNEEDYVALMHFKTKIKSDPHGITKSWNDTLHFCNWAGIQCGRENRRVTTIILPDSGLVGTLSHFLGNLSFLRELVLANNTFGGNIPPEFGRLSRLQRFNMSRNSLEGEIPVNLSNCSNLLYLSMGINRLTGKIHEELGSLSKLKYLAVWRNNLTGQIPRSIGNITTLLILSASRNFLVGTIPESLGQLKNLENLYLAYNKLSGVIPSSICNMSSLYFLSFSNNQLHGRLPEDLGLLSKLDHLMLRNNSLSGPLPHTLVNCRLLEVLDVGNNLISDSFPQWAETLPELQVLVLRLNRFHGSIGISKNKYPFSKLKIFDISQNKLNGLLPTVYFQHFEGMVNVSEEATNITELPGKYYDVHMTIVVKGNEHHDTPVIRLFVQIDVSNNNFEGELPSSLGKLKSLKSLNVSGNNLEGHIPSSLGNLTNLEALDLSSNKFVGEIPIELIQITSLAVLNLSYNHLVGKIPRGAQFNTFGNHSYIGNVALCGLPLTNMCEDKDEALLEEEDDEDEDEDDSNNYFDRDAALIGYGCGTVIGLAIGTLLLSYGRLNWIVNIVGRKKRLRGIQPL